MTKQSHISIEDKFKTAIMAVEPTPEFSERLLQQLTHKQSNKPQISPARVRFFQLLRVGVMALAMAALVITIIGPSKVLAQIQAIFGFVPGVGLVNTSVPFRQLAEPVSNTRDGITITIQSAFLSADQTIVTFQMSALPAKIKRARFGDPECRTPAYLILPDNSEMEASESRGGQAMDGSFVHEIRFNGPLPANFNQAALVFPCLEGAAQGKGPENWQIALAFKPAPGDTVVYPATLMPAQTRSADRASATIEPTLQTNLATEIPAMITDGDRQEEIIILSVVEKPDSYWVTWTYPDKSDDEIQINGYLYLAPFNPTMYDANGVELPAPDIETQLEHWQYQESVRNQLSDEEQMKYSFIYTSTVPKQGAAFPVYFKQNVYERSFPEKKASVEIEFDGTKVQTADGPVEINQDIQLGSVKFKLSAIEKDPYGGYSFLFDGADGKVIQCRVELVGYTTGVDGSGSFNLDDPFHFYQSVMYSQIPTGKLTVRISQPAVLGNLVSFIGSWSPEK